MFLRLSLCALSFCCGCSPQATQNHTSKYPAVVTDSKPFNATDYEQAAVDFRREGRLELAGASSERARQLRRAGDISTQPTPFRITAKDLDEVAAKFEAEGKYELAQEARDAARYLRSKKQPAPPQTPRNSALIL